MSDMFRGLHGGSWNCTGEVCRSAFRYWSYPAYRVISRSFRVVKETKPKYRVVRGGSRFDPAEDCRSANREWDDPPGRYDDNGFRVVKGETNE